MSFEFTLSTAEATEADASAHKIVSDSGAIYVGKPRLSDRPCTACPNPTTMAPPAPSQLVGFKIKNKRVSFKYH